MTSRLVLVVGGDDVFASACRLALPATPIVHARFLPGAIEFVRTMAPAAVVVHPLLAGDVAMIGLRAAATEQGIAVLITAGSESQADLQVLLRTTGRAP